MRALHNAAETRQRELKKVLTHVEAELEQVRYDSQSIVGSNSREARELQTRLGTQLGRHKHARETALAAERLRQAAFGGVKHVCTTLGIPPPDQDTPVNEIIHQVESVLEALMEEKDKTAQKMGDPQERQPPTSLPPAGAKRGLEGNAGPGSRLSSRLGSLRKEVRTRRNADTRISSSRDARTAH